MTPRSPSVGFRAVLAVGLMFGIDGYLWYRFKKSGWL